MRIFKQSRTRLALLGIGVIAIAAGIVGISFKAISTPEVANKNGICVVLQIDPQDAYKRFLQDIRLRSRQILRNEKVAFKSIGATNKSVVIKLVEGRYRTDIRPVFYDIKPVLKKLSFQIPGQYKSDVTVTYAHDTLTLTPTKAALKIILDRDLIGATQRMKNLLDGFKLRGYIIKPDGQSGMLVKIPKIETLDDLRYKNIISSFSRVSVVALADNSKLQPGDTRPLALGMEIYGGPYPTKDRYLGRRRPVVSNEDFWKAKAITLSNGKSGVRIFLRAEAASKIGAKSHLPIPLGLVVDNQILALGDTKSSGPPGTLDFEPLDKQQDIETLVARVKSGFYPAQVNIISETKCSW